MGDAVAAILKGYADDVVAAYLFGSVARGTNHSRSDLDLALLFKSGAGPEQSALETRLLYELELHVKRPVDLVNLENASPDLVHRVLRDGVLLLETDRRRRVEFEVRARAQYFDLAPLRKLYRYRRAAKAATGDRGGAI